MMNEFENLPSQPVARNAAEKQDIDINKLIEEALEPRVWKDHLVKDLMKF